MTDRVCLNCRAEISEKRLLALPDAELCLSCQAKLERDEAALGIQVRPRVRVVEAEMDPSEIYDDSAYGI